MFKTYKLPIELSVGDKALIKELQRQYSIVVRFAYNRFIQGYSEKDIRGFVKSLKSIDDLNSWLIQCAILDGKAVFTRFNIEKTKTENIVDGKKIKKTIKTIKEKQIFFGGKNALKRYHKNLITKEELKDKRLRPIDIQGELLHKGNRMFDLKIQDENKLIFKLNKKTKIEIQLPKLRKNWLNNLWKLEANANDKLVTYTIKLTSNHIYISFDDKLPINFKSNGRYVGIDLNPNFIGVSILENDNNNEIKILSTKNYDISNLTIKSGKSSDHKDSKYLHNKLKFETVEIAKSIFKFIKSYNCNFVFMEDLQFKQKKISKAKKSDNKGKGFNRLTLNKWLRNLFSNQLEKRVNSIGIKLFKVNPAYSSIIGNVTYDYVDPINASIEIGRRGYDLIIRKTKKFYPEVQVKNSLKEQWKQTSVTLPTGWKELTGLLKNLKVKYRVSVEECKHKFTVFSLNSKKSKVIYYNFDNNLII